MKSGFFSQFACPLPQPSLLQTFMLRQNVNFYDATYTSFFCEDLQVVLGSVRDQQFLKCLSNGKKWRYNCRDSIAHVGCGECGHSVFL
jgi:transcription elongation factor Elf1